MSDLSIPRPAGGAQTLPGGVTQLDLSTGVFPFSWFSWDRPDSPIKKTSSPRLILNIPCILSLPGLQAYASNALALTAGLVPGDLYRQGDFVGVVH